MSMVEIERKFLIRSDEYKNKATSKKRIVQGFLNTHPKRTVRVRINEDKAYLTVKGKSNVAGTSRFEWEREIDIEQAKDLLELCEKTVIEKTRYKVPNGDFMFEVDEFLRENEGLVIAEIELQNEYDVFDQPAWLGEEVTGQLKYYNSLLSKKPFKSWKK